MQISDGLEKYKKAAEHWRLTRELERQGEEIFRLLGQYSKSVRPAAVLREAKSFLAEVERWKGLSMQDQVRLAKSNLEVAIWKAFQRAMQALTDLEAVRSVMSLVGF